MYLDLPGMRTEYDKFLSCLLVLSKTFEFLNFAKLKIMKLFSWFQIQKIFFTAKLFSIWKGKRPDGLDFFDIYIDRYGAHPENPAN